MAFEEFFAGQKVLPGTGSGRPMPATEIDRPLAAKVFNTATSATDDVFVTIPGTDQQLNKWGPTRWTPRPAVAGLSYPTKGDDALVIFDDDHELWMIAWWPYA